VTVAELKSLYDRFKARPEFVAEVITTLHQLEPEAAWRAVWLLRRAAAESKLHQPDLGKIAGFIDGSDHWIFRLALCQLFSEAGVFPELREPVFPFLQRCFADRRVILRAWALTAMMGLEEDPAYRRTVRRLRRVAGHDSSKVMQARLRRLEPPNRPTKPTPPTHL
jgi:hypothetical protein